MQPIAPLRRWDVANGLARRLIHDVDLVDLHGATTVLSYQIIMKGIRLYARDATAAVWFELRLLQLYFQLNEDRRPILEQIAKTGTIYGR